MLTAQGPKLIEYNVRFGDPECEALLLRLDGDLLPALWAASTGSLAGTALRFSARHSVVVVMAAEGYPAAPRTGSTIRGLAAAAAVPGARVFHAGTGLGPGDEILAQGGRVLALGGVGETLRQARAAAYAAVDAVDWPEGFCRRDIGGRID